MTPQQVQLESFTLYMHTYPEQRFWQALRGWSQYNFIYGSKVGVEDGKLLQLLGMEDTFYKN